MLFDDAGTDRHACDRYRSSERMIGETYRDTETPREIGNRTQVHLLWRSRIRARTFQKGELTIPRPVYGSDRVLDLFERRHPSRNNHGLAGARDFLDQGGIDHFE